MKLLKNLFGRNGEYKIHPDEVALGDYVVEQGENYTKWNSGKYEIWFEDSDHIDGDTDDVLSYYDEALEDLLHKGSSVIIMHAMRTSNMSVRRVDVKRSWMTSSGAINATVVNNSSTAGNVTIRFYVLGRWK